MVSIERCQHGRTGRRACPDCLAQEVALKAQVVTVPAPTEHPAGMEHKLSHACTGSTGPSSDHAEQARQDADGDPVGDAASEGGLRVTRMSKVKTERVSWLWPGRVARGKVNLIIGDPEGGKSYASLDIAARVTAGKSWPDGAPASEPGDVILLQAEDGLADTVKARLELLGADTSRVHHLDGVRTPSGQQGRGGERQFSLDADLERLEPVLATGRIRLVIIDPLTAYLGQTDSHRDAEVRRILSPLKTMAEKYQVAILAVMHLNKDEQKAVMYRTGGSIGFVATARTVLLVAKDPQDGDRRYLIPLKSNIGHKEPALAFQINDTGLHWEVGPVNITVQEVLGGGQPPHRPPIQLLAAKEFLCDALAGGPVPVKDLKPHAEEMGLNWRTIERAATELSVLRTHNEGVQCWALRDWIRCS